MLEPMTVELPPMGRGGKPRLLAVGVRPCGCREAERARAEREAQEAAEAAAREAAARRRAHERCGIPPKFLDAPAPDAATVSKALAGESFYVHGPVGTGKTSWAAGLAKAVRDAGRSVAFASSSRIKGELFGTFGPSRESEEALFARLRSPHLLVLDDLGKEPASRAVAAMLYRVMDERDGLMRPVAVTSNFSPQDLYVRLCGCGDESVADSIASRIVGMCGGNVIAMGGRDMRTLPEAGKGKR
ncbi:AAA family ATPase [Eggerthellaceae bacterium zg-893]|nr:AAA family ATPase [Eggerthellaceae bacterium zg-893]